jgi:hypothetical protein
VDHVLEYKVEAAGHARGDEPVERDDIGVVEAAQYEDLAGHEAHALRLEVVEAHLLQRHDLAAERVPRLVHIAVRALADLREKGYKKKDSFFRLHARAAWIAKKGEHLPYRSSRRNRPGAGSSRRWLRRQRRRARRASRRRPAPRAPCWRSCSRGGRRRAQPRRPSATTATASPA